MEEETKMIRLEIDITKRHLIWLMSIRVDIERVEFPALLVVPGFNRETGEWDGAFQA